MYDAVDFGGNLLETYTASVTSVMQLDVGRRVNSVKVGSGCESVELVDEDNCQFGHSHNTVLTSNNADLPDDVAEDVCKIKIVSKPEVDDSSKGQECSVQMFNENNYGNSLATYVGTSLTGEVIPMEVGRKVKSVELSQECEIVELYDEDECKASYIDNVVLAFSTSSLPSDVEEDVCSMKIKPMDQAQCQINVPAPNPDSCTVELYSKTSYGASGSIKSYSTESTTGATATLITDARRRRDQPGERVNSVKLSSGCKSVELYDEDACRKGYSDNEKYTSSISDLPGDIAEDTCKMFLIAKPQQKCTADIYSVNGIDGHLASYTRSSMVGEEVDLWTNRRRRESPGQQVQSVKLGTGCRSVELVDEDNCQFGHADNDIITASQPQLPGDIKSDTCKMKIQSKQKEDAAWIAYKEHDCVVELYADENLQGTKLQTFRVGGCQREQFTLSMSAKDSVSSVKIRGNCRVELFDGDECRTQYEDNLVAQADIMRLPYDLNDDICGLLIWNDPAAPPSDGTYSTPSTLQGFLQSNQKGLVNAVTVAFAGGECNIKDINDEEGTYLPRWPEDEHSCLTQACCYTKAKTGVIRTPWYSIFLSLNSVSDILSNNLFSPGTSLNQETIDGITYSVFKASGGPLWNTKPGISYTATCAIMAALRLEVCNTCHCSDGLIRYNTLTSLTRHNSPDCHAWFVMASSSFLMYFSAARNKVLVSKMELCKAASL